MRRPLPWLLLAVSLVSALGGCGLGESPAATPEDAGATFPAPTAAEGEEPVSFELTSTAFGPEESIPSVFTCDGRDVSPPLQWTDPPQGTQSFALISDDPDAPMGTWVHWVLFNLPAEVRALPEAVAPDAELADGSRHGTSSFRRLGYGGPCPPSGTHRYFFKLYALDTVLDLPSGANKKQLLEAMEGHILAQVELMGRYARQ